MCTCARGRSNTSHRLDPFLRHDEDIFPSRATKARKGLFRSIKLHRCVQRFITRVTLYSYLIALQHGFAAFVVERLSHRVRRQVFLLGQIEGGVRINVFGIFGYSFQGAHLATGRLLPRLPHGRVILFPLLHVVLVLQRRLGLRARIIRSPRPFRVCNHRDSLVSE